MASWRNPTATSRIVLALYIGRDQTATIKPSSWSIGRQTWTTISPVTSEALLL
ncbi:MAG: hypothetical protein ABSG37_10540 [Candidatus Limnocylindrales bacterium]